MLPQPLETTGNAIKWRGEGGDDEKPSSMPTPDAHANRTFRGRSGKLKSGPMSPGRNGQTLARGKRRRK